MQSTMTDSLKAIIIGGGPGGIMMAHALDRAGIDFIVLEYREDPFKNASTALALDPASLRVELIKKLYDHLPEQAKKRYTTGKKLLDIDPTPTGVTVTCTDGTRHTGTFVVGADGEHSKTRSVMRKLALDADPALAAPGAWDPERPFKATYRLAWLSGPGVDEPGLSYEILSHQRAAYHLTSKNGKHGWLIMYEKKLPGRVRGSDNSNKDKKKEEDEEDADEQADADADADPSVAKRYTEKDWEAVKDRFADWSISPTLKVRDVVGQCRTSGMADLMEGVVRHRSWAGKIVLVGDSSYKFAPNAGQGFNSVLQDVASLCNLLVKRKVEAEVQALALAQGVGGKGAGSGVAPVQQHEWKPDAAELDRVFEQHSRSRQEDIDAADAASVAELRLQAWPSALYSFLALFVFRWNWLLDFIMATVVVPRIANSRVLDYVPATEEPFVGTKKYLYPVDRPIGKAEA